MKSDSSRLVIILDSPMNAYVISLLEQKFDSVEVIYAIDPSAKNEQEYVSMFRLLLSNLHIASEVTFHYDSKSFWTIDRESVVQELSFKLKKIIKANDSVTTYFGNALTNPVAAAAQRLVNLNHLYHSPTDFSFLLIDRKLQESVKSVVKYFVGKVLGRRSAYVALENGAIFTLVDFQKLFPKQFSHINYLKFSLPLVEEPLKPLIAQLSMQRNRIVLLLAGSEPGPGDENPSNIRLFLKPHLDAVAKLMREDDFSEATVWIREHRSYIPLSADERALLVEHFTVLGCIVFFMSDFIPLNFRLLPAECIFRYCHFDYLIGEPSSLLLNIAGGPIKLVAACSQFVPFRDKGQLERNNDFIKMNEMLGNSCRCI